MKLADVTYHRPNIDQLEAELKQATQDILLSKSYEDVQANLAKTSEAIKSVQGMAQLASVRYSQNTKDAFYEQEQEYIDSISPRISKSWTDYTNALLDSPFINELKAEFGYQFFDLAELSRASINEAVMPLLQKENILSSDFQKLISQIKINFEEKTYNLSGMAPLLEDTDRKRRKAASKAMYGVMYDNQPELDRIFDELVKVRVEIAKKLGFDHFTPLGYHRMGRTAYGVKEVSQYREFVLKYVTPKAKILKEKIGKSLGLSSMYHYDTLIFEDGNATPKTSPEQMIADAQIMYNELSKETGEFFNTMQEKGMLDLLNRDNKSPGGYCTYLDPIKSPFIFSNFNGTSHDVDVLTHEAGHAFQCYCSTHFPLAEYYFPTSESAEIHSMSMEFFAWDWVDRFFKEDTAKYKLGHLMKSFLFLPYGVTVDEFQHKIYENPEMSPEERRQTYLEVQAKYMPWVQYDQEPYLENGGRWQNQSHIYQMPFYYIDYTLAQISAFQFFEKMNIDFEAAWNDYYQLCCAGGSKHFLDLLKIGNLDSPFNEEKFKRTIDFIFSKIESMYEEYYLAKGQSNS